MRVIANHPDTQIVDGTVQGITPVLVCKNGSVKKSKELANGCIKRC